MVGTMENIRLFPFLHKKHNYLAPKLAAVLKQMKDDELFEEYRAQAAKSLEGVK